MRYFMILSFIAICVDNLQAKDISSPSTEAPKKVSVHPRADSREPAFTNSDDFQISNDAGVCPRGFKILHRHRRGFFNDLYNNLVKAAKNVSNGIDSTLDQLIDYVIKWGGDMKGKIKRLFWHEDEFELKLKKMKKERDEMRAKEEAEKKAKEEAEKKAKEEAEKKAKEAKEPKKSKKEDENKSKTKDKE